MWKAALAGAVLALGMNAAAAEDYTTASIEPQARESQARGRAVSEGHIASLKAALKLRPGQQQYWPAVESALRGISARSQAASDGLARRAAALVVDANDLRRLSAVAAPLIASLDDTQKENGLRVVRSMGFGHLAAAF